MPRTSIAAWAWMLPLCLLLCTARYSPAQEPLVGGACDFSAIRIEGARIIPAEQVRQALQRDWMIHLHATPTAPRQQLLRTIRQRLGLAYAAAGFPDAKCEAAYDDAQDRLVVTIEEGQRFNNGPVRVAGVPHELSQGLVEGLTQPRAPTAFKMRREIRRSAWIVEHTPSDEQTAQATWEAGAPAKFDYVSQSRLQARVWRMFAERGHLQPVFELKMIPEDGQAVLALIVTDPGPQAQIGNITIHGLQRSSGERVIELLGAKVGDAVDVHRLQAMQQRLWESGRFLAHTISLIPMRDPATQMQLRVDLVEVAGVAALGEPLSDSELALMRVAQWFSRMGEGRSDLLLEFSQPQHAGASCILSPGQGMFAQLDVHREERAAMRETLAIMDDQLLRRSEPGGRLGVATVGAGGLELRLHVVPSDKPDSAASLSIGAGVNTAPQAQRVRFHTHVAPAVLLLMLHHRPEQTTQRREEGVLIIDFGRGDELRIREDSGELISFAAEREGALFRIIPGQGLLSERVEQEKMDDREPDSLTAGQVIASILSPLVVMHWDLDTVGEEMVRAIEPLAASLVDSVLGSWPGEQQFFVPVHPDEIFAGQLAEMLKLALPLVDELFVAGQWPWTTARQTLLALAGNTQHLHSELDRLRQSSMGPLGYAVGASLMSRANAQLARSLAREGLQRLETEQFLSDCRTLLDPAGGLGAMLRQMLAALREMDGEAVARLERSPSAVLQAVGGLAAGLQAHGRSLDEALEPALRELWEKTLRQRIEDDLNQLAAP